MSFEAVPCKFTCRAGDGNEAPLFGLLIRPSASQQQQGFVGEGTTNTTSTVCGSSSNNSLVALSHQSTSSATTAASSSFITSSSSKELPLIRPKTQRQQQQQQNNVNFIAAKKCSTPSADRGANFSSQFIQIPSGSKMSMAAAQVLTMPGGSATSTPILPRPLEIVAKRPTRTYSASGSSQQHIMLEPSDHNMGLLTVSVQPEESSLQSGNFSKKRPKKPTVVDAKAEGSRQTQHHKISRKRKSRQPVLPDISEASSGLGTSTATHSRSCEQQQFIHSEFTQIDLAQYVGGVSEHHRHMKVDGHHQTFQQPTRHALQQHISVPQHYIAPPTASFLQHDPKRPPLMHPQQQHHHMQMNLQNDHGQQQQHHPHQQQPQFPRQQQQMMDAIGGFSHHHHQEMQMFLPSPSVGYPPQPPPTLMPGNVVPSSVAASYMHHQQNVGWHHPYAAPIHPRTTSQFSSCTPDSGIQSIDGSPPSIASYTPPMVSPYTMQLTASCESAASSTFVMHSGFVAHQPASVVVPLGNVDRTPLAAITSPSVELIPSVEPQNPPSDCAALSDNEGLDDDDDDHQLDAHSDANDLSDMPQLKPFTAEDFSVEQQHTSESGSNIVVRSRNSDSPNLVNSMPSVESLSSFQQEQRRSEADILSLVKSSKSDEISLSELAEKLSMEQLLLLTSLKQSKEAGGSLAERERSLSSASFYSNNAHEKQQQQELMPPITRSSSHRDSNLPPAAATDSTETMNGFVANPEEYEQLMQYRKIVRKRLNQQLLVIFEQMLQRLGKMHIDESSAALNIPIRRRQRHSSFKKLNWSKIRERCKQGECISNEEGTRFLRASKIEYEHEGKVESQSKKRGRKRKLFSPSCSEKTEVNEHFETTKKNESEKRESPFSLKIKTKRKRTSREDFIRIRTNHYIDHPVLPLNRESLVVCECAQENPCGSNQTCKNFLQKIECTSSSCCIAAETCKNRRISGNQTIHLQMMAPGNRSLGVKTTVAIFPGQYLCEFVGECIRHSSYSIKKRTADSFALEFVPGYVLDASHKGNISRFIRHSCEPNCEFQRWLVNNEYRMGVFALEEIGENKELTCNFNSALHPVYAGETSSNSCSCDFPSCRHAEATTSKTVADVDKSMSETAAGKVITSCEMSIVRDKHVFLLRNLRVTYDDESRRMGRQQTVLHSKYKKLVGLLRKLLFDFLKFCKKKASLNKRMLNHFKRLACLALSDAQSVAKDESPRNIVATFDEAVCNCLLFFKQTLEKRTFDLARAHYLSLKRSLDLQKACPSISKDVINDFLKDRRHFGQLHQQTKKDAPRILSTEFDLNYMDSPNSVGSYDPDQLGSLIMSEADSSNEDCVRCICGIADDGGEMIQCDKCHFWLHTECHDSLSGDPLKEYFCDFCTRHLKYASAVDVIFRSELEIKLRGCTYYRALCNSYAIQVRINETVYVKRLINDRHKSILKSIYEDDGVKSGESPLKKKDENVKKRSTKSSKNCADECIKTSLLKNCWWPTPTTKTQRKKFHHKDLRVFKVERLFVGPNGERFVFGCYYARPHETFSDPSRMFHKNELFSTPFFDTLPLDAVVGRCLVLRPNEWTSGRLKSPRYLEEDVYVCEFQIDKSQKIFDKSKNPTDVNTDPYIFERFAAPLPLKRDFTPFILNSSAANAFLKSPEKSTSTIREWKNSNTKKVLERRLERVCSRLLILPPSRDENDD